MLYNIVKLHIPSHYIQTNVDNFKVKQVLLHYYGSTKVHVVHITLQPYLFWHVSKHIHLKPTKFDIKINSI